MTLMKKLDPDQEYSLYKVTYMGVESYCIGTDISDVLAGYEEKYEVTKIEYFDTAYLSPNIVKGN